MTKTYRATLVKFVNSIYGETNVQMLLKTKNTTYEQLALDYIDELGKHGSKVQDLQSTLQKLNEPAVANTVSDRCISHLENWMHRVISERRKASRCQSTK